MTSPNTIIADLQEQVDSLQKEIEILESQRANWMEQYRRQGESAQALIDNLKAQLSNNISIEPIGESGSMPGTTGFTMACFVAKDVPVGTKIFTEHQLLAATQRTADACAKACESIANEYDTDGVYAEFFANLIRNGDWRNHYAAT